MLKFTARLLVVLVVFTLTFEGVSRVFAIDENGDMVNLARLLLHEFRRSEALQELTREIREAKQIRKAAVEDYIAARLTFAEVVEQFMEAERFIEPTRGEEASGYRKLKTKKEFCLLAFVWIQTCLNTEYKDSSSTVNSVRSRLKRELKEQLPQEEISKFMDSLHSRFLLSQSR